jgi:hypothetical protein
MRAAMSRLPTRRLRAGVCATVLAAAGIAGSVSDSASATPPYGTIALSYSSQLVGTTSEAKTAWVKNTGSTPIMVDTSIDGPGAANFVKGYDTCSREPLRPSMTCSVSVTFAPRSASAFAATLSFSSIEWSSPYVVPLTGTGVPPADLKVLGPGVNYSGGYQLVTRTVPSSGSRLMVHKLGILNEDTVARSYGLRLTASGAPATAEVWTTGYGAKVLAKDASGMFIPPPVAPGRVLTLDLRVTPTTPGQHVSRVDVDLISEHDGLMERVSTETNTPAPAKGTWEWEMTARQGGQPFVGGQGVTPTVTAPALNVGQSAVFTVRLKNDGASPARIPL